MKPTDFFRAKQKVEEVRNLLNTETVLALIIYGQKMFEQAKHLIQTGTYTEFEVSLAQLRHDVLAVQYNLKVLDKALIGMPRFGVAKLLDKQTAYSLN